MDWMIYWIGAVVCLAVAVVLAIIRGKTPYKSGRLLDPTRILFVGVVLSTVVLFLPICLRAFADNDCGLLETVLIAVYNMIGLFLVNGDFGYVTEQLQGLSGGMFTAYSVLFSILFLVAPLLTFGFVLSFFKNLAAYKRYITHYTADVFVFSALNERSLALAQSLHAGAPKNRLLVFTAVSDRVEEEQGDLVEQAKELGAICFKKDMVTVDLTFHSRKNRLNFFAIGDDHSDNVYQALKLIAKLKYRDNTHLYVFSAQTEAEMLLANACGKPDEPPYKIRVRRINEVRSLIHNLLYDTGFDTIFQTAYDHPSGVKRITAAVVGMGQHGQELTKALAWFCQMDGYQLELHAFDKDEYAAERFASLCPELMADGFNGQLEADGEARYAITVHNGMDVDAKTFDDTVLALPRVTYVFVALGSDEKNIATAVKLRSLFLRAGYTPAIQAVVSSADKKEALTGITNFKGQAYDIAFVGDRQSTYSEAVVLRSQVEEKALQRHLKWGSEEDFWRYDYNYRSSIASAIHQRMKIACGIPGADKPLESRTEEEKQALRNLEHRRWNAYMRADGYCYAATRNDLAKTHPCLVPFDRLPLSEQVKDDD